MSGFMQLRVWQDDAVTTRDGLVLPREQAEADQKADPIESVDQPDMWWGEYTASGYMDRTDACGPFETPVEAVVETFKLLGAQGCEGEQTGDETEAIAFLCGELGVEERSARAMLGMPEVSP